MADEQLGEEEEVEIVNDNNDDDDVLAEGFVPESFLIDGDKPLHGVTQAWLLTSQSFYSFFQTFPEETKFVIQCVLMHIASEVFPTPSRVKKALRRSRVLLFRRTSPSTTTSITSTLSSPLDLQSLGVIPKQWKVLKVGMVVCEGDIIGLQDRMGGEYYPAVPHSAPKFKLEVLYEDDHVAVIDKPAGIACYGDKHGGHGRNTVRAALPYCLHPPQPGVPHCFRLPRLIHRIDRDTSGLLLAAKTRIAHSELSRQFRDRSVKKCYVAVLMGSLPVEPKQGLSFPRKKNDVEKREACEKGIVTKNIDKQAGNVFSQININNEDDSNEWGIIEADVEEKAATTHWKVEDSMMIELKGTPKIELHRVLFRPHTGRKHQLRIHSKDVLECPILGDKKYDLGTALAEELRNSGMYLHAASLEFPHPISGMWVMVQSNPPPKFSDLWQIKSEARIFRSLRAAASKFRTKPCLFFLTNSCNKGDACVYKHELPKESSLTLLDSLLHEIESHVFSPLASLDMLIHEFEDS